MPAKKNMTIINSEATLKTAGKVITRVLNRLSSAPLNRITRKARKNRKGRPILSNVEPSSAHSPSVHVEPTTMTSSKTFQPLKYVRQLSTSSARAHASNAYTTTKKRSAYLSMSSRHRSWSYVVVAMSATLAMMVHIMAGPNEGECSKSYASAPARVCGRRCNLSGFMRQAKRCMSRHSFWRSVSNLEPLM